MTRKGNKAGHGWATFICTKCGCVTNKRKSLAVKGGRTCRDVEACAHRKAVSGNDTVLEAQ